MKRIFLTFLSVVLLPFAGFASQEGVPTYYKTGDANAAVQQSGYTNYVGQSGQKQTVGARNYSYQVPRAVSPNSYGTMTPNGVALPVADEAAWKLAADFTRRWATFQFETGVNSILKWNDMVFNEIGAQVQHNFSLRNTDLFVSAEYNMGTLSTGGMSMDYDLKPYDEAYPDYGIFTISMGDMSGKTDTLRLGFGAHHVWDLGGWKLSPSIGYEIFHHNLEMSNHIYPNPGVYLPLMTDTGEYVFGDAQGNYFSIPTNGTPKDEWYQVCMSPEDMKIVTGFDGTNLITGDWNEMLGNVPWGVGAGECVIIGGDGIIIVPGTTHIYNTTWSGVYLGLEMEKQMTLTDKLRFYVQVGMPNYSAEGTWPNRTDWQQNPSFIDKGSNGSYSYRAEMEYNYKMSDRLSLALKADMNYFYVGKIPGELYVAAYSAYLVDENGQYVLDGNDNPIIETTEAHTEYIEDSLKNAIWQSFGLHFGVKYSF